MAESSSECGAVIVFKGSQAGFEELATRHDDDVEPGRDFVMPENFSYQPFRAISLNGAAELFRCRDAQAARGRMVGQGEDRAESSMDPGTVLVDALEFGAPANPLMRMKTCVGFQWLGH
jgi:hypothetical protein